MEDAEYQRIHTEKIAEAESVRGQMTLEALWRFSDGGGNQDMPTEEPARFNVKVMFAEAWARGWLWSLTYKKKGGVSWTVTARGDRAIEAWKRRNAPTPPAG